MPCKITLIGAGSVVFAKKLVGDILQFPELSDSHITLMDIDPSRLKTAEVLMKRIVAELGVKARIEATLDQRKAVKGANYVISTIQVGGFKPSTVRDFEIPKRYGLKQTIADTLGIGGIFRGLRTIPVINSIARDIAETGASNCLFLNYSNPMAMNCWAMSEAVGIPNVGLCHSVFGTAMSLAHHAGLPYEDVRYLVAGINHMAFFLKFQYRDQDAYPLLFKLMEDPKRDFELVRYEMMRRTGYFVTESSEHQSEYVPYFIPHGQKVIEQFRIPIDEYIRRCETIIASWKRTESKLLGDRSGIQVEPQSHEYGSYIIHSRETDTPRTVYGNVPNTGIIDNLLTGCCVEVPCLVDGTGLHAVKIGSLPDQLAALCMTNVNVQRLTVTAALTGKREHIYHAAMLDPNTAATLPLDKIWALCDDLIAAHQKDGYLGEFSPVVKNTGRSLQGVGDRVIARLSTRRIEQDKRCFELVAQVENKGMKPTEVRLAIQVENPLIFAEPKSLRLRLRPGQFVEKTIKARLKGPLQKAERITLASPDHRVLAIGTFLYPRTVLRTDPTGKTRFDLELSGFPAAEGYIGRSSKGIEVSMTVNDSNLRSSLNGNSRGSSVDLYFASEENTAIRHVSILPGSDKKGCVIIGGETPPKARISLHKTMADYHFKVFLPYEVVRVPGKGPFYFHAVVNINALGDAHSGGRSALGGNLHHLRRSTHYCEVNPGREHPKGLRSSAK